MRQVLESNTLDYSGVLGAIASMVVLCTLPVVAVPPANAATITVTSTSDGYLPGSLDGNGTCDLREAIEAANANSSVDECSAGDVGLDTIAFNIGAGGLHTIQPVISLPTIVDPVILDGTTQPGCSGTPCIELDGSEASTGFSISAGSSTVRGFVINRFWDGVRISGAGGNTIEGNYIGTDQTGALSLSNLYGVRIDNSPNNTIGGTESEARNVISGNDQDWRACGVKIEGAGALGNTVLGNYIGTDVAGSASLPNEKGIEVNGASENTIGGLTVGARNIISGNSFAGVFLVHGANGNTILGNYIGTDVTGATGLGNRDGVVLGNAFDNQIGGTENGAGNVISGNGINGRGGVFIHGETSTGNLVQGNFIGTDVSGSIAIGNGIGVWVDAAPDNIIGGTEIGAGNIVGGNVYQNIIIDDFDGIGSDRTTVQGNYLGTDVTGTVGLGPEEGLGVFVWDSDSVLIGGVTPGAGNVISGNGGGISTRGDNTQILGNHVGTDPSGTLPVPNVAFGIRIEGDDCVAGGSGTGEANTIAFNGGTGVWIEALDTSPDPSMANIAVGNSIFSNDDLGIDLSVYETGNYSDPDGPTPNDLGDADIGPNGLQNYPVLTSAEFDGGTVTVRGVLNSTSNSDFDLHFYANTEVDPSGYGEGEFYLGEMPVSTDSNGYAWFSTEILSSPLETGYVAATATAADGSTSEFSLAVGLEAVAPRTYYVQPNGGDHFQCSGTSTAPYSGSGYGQACAWDHPFRALPPGGTPRIKGGDTLIIDSGDYQMGFGGPGDDACDAAGAFDCYMPPLPSGLSPELPTRLMGSGWDSGCEEPPELWGSERTSLIVNLAGSSNVEVACLEITDHSGCIEFHSGSLECERDTPPFGDWGGIGLFAEDSTNVLLSDLDIHGLAAGGINAGRLQDWSLERVRINGNGWYGWDGDISGDDNNLGTIGFDHVEIAWNGCGETWPAEEIDGCWDQTAGGYGDGLGTGSTGGTWVFEDCEIHHNTSDGIDLYYLEPGGRVEVRRTESQGNAGDQLKIAGEALVENSLLVSNCGNFDGWPLMSDHCRGGGFAFLADLHQGSTAVLVNNTLASEGDCLLIAECTDGDCDGSEQVLVQNSVLIGATDFWQPTEDSCLYWWDDSQLPSNPVDLDWNLVSGVKNQKDVCPQGADDLCVSDPGLVNPEIDSFNGRLLEESAAVDSGLPVDSTVGSTTVPDHDLENTPRPLGDGTDRGAYEYQAPIFSDGFESGDTSKWSSTMP